MYGSEDWSTFLRMLPLSALWFISARHTRWQKYQDTFSVLFLSLVLIQATNAHGIAQYRLRNTTDSAFSHLGYFQDYEAERVYIGAKNKLIQLKISPSGTFVEDIIFVTGPQNLVSLNCDQSNVGPFNLTNNYNRILLVSEVGGTLITCGSVCQGTCQLRELANISSITKDSETWVNFGQENVYSFLTQSPVNRNQLDMVVGLTDINIDPYYDNKAYSLSIRYTSEENAFNSVREGSDYAAGVTAKSGYKIYYRAGFAYNDYVYMLTNQLFPGNTRNESKIQRVCNKFVNKTEDYKNFHSLMDMRISCSLGNKTYSLITSAAMVNSSNATYLVAGFTDGENPEHLSQFNSSAICVFAMFEVNKVFQENLDQCLNTSYTRPGLSDLYWNNWKLECPQTNFYFGTESCEIAKTGFAMGLIGFSGIKKTELVTEISDNSTSYITAIQSQKLSDQMVILFMGTSDGKILKGYIQSDFKQMEIYDVITVEENQPINNDLLFDQNKTHILAMTPDLVVRYPIENCSQHQTCRPCVTSNDPFCGWCVLEKKCSIRTQCEHSGDNNYWISSVPGETCLNLEVFPLNIIIQQLPIQLSLTVKSLPELKNSDSFSCWFPRLGTTTKLNKIDNTLTCQSPSEITSPSPRLPIRIGLVRTGLPGIQIVMNTTTFINCSALTSCFGCVDVSPCKWIIYNNVCTYNESLYPAEGDTVEVASSRSSCPNIKDISPKAIPSNVSTVIRITGENFPDPVQTKYHYVCEFIGIKTPFRALWISNSLINCSSEQQPIESSSGEKLLTVKLLFFSGGQSALIDGSDRKVTLYNCTGLGTDCSTCGSYNKEFQSDKDYDCHWCGNICHYSNERCQETPCPPPIIYNVGTSSSHTHGGTSVTITGKELGRGYTDVTNIKLAGLPCNQESSKFLVSKRVVCTTIAGPSQSGGVQITVRHQKSNQSQSFRFADPTMSRIWPTKGPIDGGTILTILGKDLLVGNDHKVTLEREDKSIDCFVMEDRSIMTDLVCKTRAVEEPVVFSEVHVEIDGWNLTNVYLSFNYTINPTLKDMVPRTSFKSGGRTINITGTNLDSIQTPKLFLRKGGSMCSKPEICYHSVDDNTTLIHCPSPTEDGVWKSCQSLNITPLSGRPKRQANGGTSVGLLMDAVGSVLKPPANFRIFYISDPSVHNLTENSEFKPETLLYITGVNLSVAATKEDFSVFVCNSSCHVTNLNNTNLVCTLPKSAQECEENQIPVEVKVGYANYYIGNLVVTVDSFPLQYILPPLCVIVVLIIALLVITLKYRKHKHKRRKDMMQLQNEYELLERSVRQKARQEFADLQQDIQLITSDVINAGVPYKPLPYYTYAMLFPGELMGENHLLNNSQISIDNNEWQERSKQLDSLIQNKFFLLTTLRSLEAEKKLSAKDKSSLANVLTVILLDKQDYLMEIWKELFKEHVAKAVDKKQQKQIMRRNESIVEKLVSNWVALSMFNNLQEHTGSSLFMLYKATEMLTSYGAADAVSGEAHYTLSEERLLKETLFANPLNVHVMVNGEEFACKVLDCDTISQAKQKFLNQIYKSVPVSSRPRQDQVDLEWQWGKNGRLILDDFDNTCEIDPVGKWKRLNTLKHYNVMDESVMGLLSKEDEGIETDSPYANFGQSSDQLISPNDVNVDMDFRLWHLVRESDDIGETKQRIIEQIYLSRLVSTKVPLLQYLDHFVDTVFNPNTVPKAIKFLFDYFDELLQLNGLQDSDVGHIWKSNSLPIRYWGSLLKAPHHAFDVNRPDLSEPSQEVLAQCFIDSCSLTQLKLGKDSPASKLLFSRDVQRYREIVTRFYCRIMESTTVTNEEVSMEIGELSSALQRNNLFNTKAALYDFCRMIQENHENIIAALEENPEAKKLQLGHKLEKFLDEISV